MNLGILVGIILMIILFLFSYCACVISSRYSRLEEEEDMSILQEYEENEKIIGKGKVKAISDYIKYCDENNRTILYSDIVYKPEEYELFSEWFENAIKPFSITHYDEDSDFSVILWQDDYWYDWLEEIKTENNHYGDGHCYEDAFKDYVESNFNDLHKRIKYDSENGMFCAYCNDIKDAEELTYELVTLYKDEFKMLNLIKETKQKYGYQFDISI